ncbi:sodium:solute symporter family transporter [Bacteroides thetaiotaomicron]|uniref:sodium:solute symporter family transporter n=1 Tax=Bacteroides thetaiotaomicron TaxID=818 RepID=UPI001EEC1B77|nr:sodium/solute symporter [Bacteroides thetaiotaomicron]MCE8778821.1 sodium/solute symporter [Bacteroides thetaiotaomicron]
MQVTVSFIDIAVIVVSTGLIICWALKKGKSGDSKSYFLAGRSMSWIVVGLSLFAASISSTTLIGQTGDAYSTGIAVFNYNLVGVVVMVFFATFILPIYINSGIFTIPEFLERRFDVRSRYYFSAICIIGNVFLDAATALYAAALIIKLLVPSVDIQVIVIIFALLAASYTIPGGLSSAINAEIIQACILIVGSVLLAIYVTVSGGFDYLKELFISGDYMVKLIRPLDDSSTPWLALIIGMPITGLYFWANNQTLVQRVLSAKNLNEGRKGVMLNGGITLTTLFLFAMPGVMCQKLFPDLGSPDMVYPAMILNLMPVGLLGIMIAVLFAALTSALSAIMNSTSTLFTMDFYCKIDKHANDKKLVRVGRIVSVIVIVIAALWAPQIGKFGSILKYYQEMLAYLAPPIVAAFIVGIFSRRVNGQGVFFGLMSGFVIAVLLLFFKTSIFGDMHFLFIVPILFVFSILVMYLMSLCSAAPLSDKLNQNIFTLDFYRKETVELSKIKWYSNYRIWGVILLVLSGILLLILS